VNHALGMDRPSPSASPAASVSTEERAAGLAVHGLGQRRARHVPGDQPGPRRVHVGVHHGAVNMPLTCRAAAPLRVRTGPGTRGRPPARPGSAPPPVGHG
jgi:hypothetical protein